MALTTTTTTTITITNPNPNPIITPLENPDTAPPPTCPHCNNPPTLTYTCPECIGSGSCERRRCWKCDGRGEVVQDCRCARTNIQSTEAGKEEEEEEEEGTTKERKS
ncbi:hypothetical protein EX30DRAFT_117408 [Ascodesmis nigricans]|uniref:Uncharacterized protein n=1 Tax=Ascodesmis nigricans TaxID=341454 RepID=A0A4S2MS01_9PEZI|nr:hypothetical protein EX30DRAFT_117408 [Ascodesmis nigricans]